LCVHSVAFLPSLIHTHTKQLVKKKLWFNNLKVFTVVIFVIVDFQTLFHIHVHMLYIYEILFASEQLQIWQPFRNLSLCLRKCHFLVPLNTHTHTHTHIYTHTSLHTPYSKSAQPIASKTE